MEKTDFSQDFFVDSELSNHGEYHKALQQISFGKSLLALLGSSWFRVRRCMTALGAKGLHQLGRAVQGSQRKREMHLEALGT